MSSVIDLPRFSQPLILLALVIPALLLVWTWSYRWLLPTRRVVLPLDRARGSSGWVWWTFIALADSLPSLLLAIGILLLAGPQTYGPPKQKRSLTNIQFAVDVSGSMTAPFGEGTRYDASMAAINQMVDYRKGDAFGLTFFGVAFVHWVPLTSDPSALKCAPPFMKPEIAPPAFGGTAIANVLRGIKPVLAEREEGDKMVILISDGESYDLQEAEQDITRSYKEAGITVFAIIVGGINPQDEVVNICRNTGGEAFRADDPEALPAVFRKIDSMKQAKVTPTIVDTVDHFRPYTLVGLVLVGLSCVCLFGLRYTPW
jgi:Ca-activated chloride channel family protein